MKYSVFIYQLLRMISRNPDGALSFIEWAVSAIIDAVVIGAIVAWIAKQCGEEFKDWFLGSCVVVVILDFILFLLS